MDAAELALIPLFAALSKNDREQVARLTDVADVAAGKKLVSEGEFAYEFFVIEEGEADVTQGDKLLRRLRAGDFFGEIALLETERRTATVTSATPMQLVVMHARDFRQMEHSMPEVAERVREAIRQRL